MRCIFTSDWHLGYEYCNYSSIQKSLDQILNAKDELQLYLLGDIFDLWRNPIDKDCWTEPQMNSILASLHEIIDKFPVLYIPGNHDYILRYTGPGIEILKILHLENLPISTRDPYHLRHVGFLTHGWQFDLEIRNFAPLFVPLCLSFPWIYQRFFKKPSQVLSEQGFSELCAPIHEQAAQFACRNVGRVIMGHTHCPHIAEHVMDCGDFVDSCSYIELENGHFNLVRL